MPCQGRGGGHRQQQGSGAWSSMRDATDNNMHMKVCRPTSVRGLQARAAGALLVHKGMPAAPLANLGWASGQRVQRGAELGLEGGAVLLTQRPRLGAPVLRGW